MIKSSSVRNILMLSLFAVAVLPCYMFFYLHPSFTKILIDKTEEEAARFTQHLAATLVPELHVKEVLSITPAFKEEVETIRRDMGLVEVKVYSPSGEIIYSTESRDIGEINRRAYFHEIVAKGKTYSRVVKKSSPSLEGKIMTRDVAETYAPLMRNGRFIGAFELYYDITGTHDKLTSLIAQSSVIVFFATISLCAGLVISAFRMREGIRARDHAEEDLKRHQEQLEQMMAERTREILDAGARLEQENLEKQQMAMSLRNTEAKYRSLVDSTEDSIYVIDRDCRYLFMNKQHLIRMGLVDGQFLGHHYSEFHSREETAEFIGNVNRVFETEESCQIEHKSERDGKYFLQTLSPVKDQGGKTIAVTVVSKDITKRKSMEEELRALSLTDELTGLYNRRGFMTLAEQCFRLANRMNIKVPVGYADLDGLKAINDSFGHHEGDKALIEAAEAFRESFRDSDIIARIGGDEFVVVPIANNGTGIEAALDRLQKNIAVHNAQQGRNYTLSVSIGIAYYDPQHPFSIEELLDQGDKMMYEQKKAKARRADNPTAQT